MWCYCVCVFFKKTLIRNVNVVIRWSEETNFFTELVIQWVFIANKWEIVSPNKVYLSEFLCNGLFDNDLVNDEKHIPTKTSVIEKNVAKLLLLLIFSHI